MSKQAKDYITKARRALSCSRAFAVSREKMKWAFMAIERLEIDAAKQRGVQFGRPRKPLPENFDEVRMRWERGEITGTAAARECSLSMTTFRRRAEMEKNQAQA